MSYGALIRMRGISSEACRVASMHYLLGKAAQEASMCLEISPRRARCINE